MRIRDVLPVALVVLSLPFAVAGCGDKKEGPPAKPPAHDHATAPHGGELLVLGEEEGHVELIHDSKDGNVTVYILDKDAKTPVAVKTPTILLTTKEGPREFALTAVNPAADGTADTWKGTHPGLAVEPLDGRIRVTFRGKNYQSPLEAAPHDH